MTKMLHGPEQFKDWMRRRGFTQADACRFLGFDEPYLSGLLTGRRSPGLTNAVHIERLTGISVEAWASALDNDAERQPALAGKRKIHRA